MLEGIKRKSVQGVNEPQHETLLFILLSTTKPEQNKMMWDKPPTPNKAQQLIKPDN